MSIAPTPRAVEYPSGDGQPMAETWLHVRAIMLLHQALEDFFRGRDDVFIASDIFWFWEEGNPDSRISPDVMVVPGVRPRDPRERRSFFSWEEGGAVPAVVFEMASRSTWQDDIEDKFDRYEQFGVREYFLFDPEAAYLVPVLQGYRLSGSAYRRIRGTGGDLPSELGFLVRAEDTTLRLVDGRTGRPIPTREEAVEETRRAADAERQRADAERQRADALAAELAALRERLTGGSP
jgi:Uma2 family endonuclease